MSEAKKEAAKAKQKVVIKVDCPECGTSLIVKRFRERVVDPVPAEYEEWATAEKDDQKTLGFGENENTNTSAKKDKKKPKKKKAASGKTKTKKKRKIRDREPHQDALV